MIASAAADHASDDASRPPEGTVGVVGAGMIGTAVITRLVPEISLLVWDPDPEARSRVAATGAALATSVHDLRACSVILLSLPGPPQVRTVVSELLAGRGTDERPQVIVDLSTVDPQTSVELAADSDAAGVGYLDAPILGRPHRCGAWTLPVGGSIDALELARPVLDRLAARVVPVGGPGRGNTVKLLNNLMFGAINAITVETMAAAARLGLDPEVYASTLADSGAASVSGLFTELAPKIVAADYSPTFTIDLLAKDNRLALTMIEPTGLTLPVAETVARLNEAAQEAGLGGLDTSAMIIPLTR